MNLRKRLWISERIKELGKKKKDLAKALGLPHTRISDMISGTRALKITEIEAFSAYMEMSIDEVLIRFSGNDWQAAPHYDGLGHDERDVIKLYRELSGPAKQKFHALAQGIKKEDDNTPGNEN